MGKPWGAGAGRRAFIAAGSVWDAENWERIERSLQAEIGKEGIMEFRIGSGKPSMGKGGRMGKEKGSTEWNGANGTANAGVALGLSRSRYRCVFVLRPSTVRK